MRQQKMAYNLRKGDLIAVAYNNYMFPAIYLDEGKTGCPRFVMIKNQEGINWMETFLKEKGRVYKEYMVREGENIIVRIYEKDMSPEQRDRYLKTSDLLRKYNII